MDGVFSSICLSLKVDLTLSRGLYSFITPIGLLYSSKHCNDNDYITVQSDFFLLCPQVFLQAEKDRFCLHYTTNNTVVYTK